MNRANPTPHNMDGTDHLISKKEFNTNWSRRPMHGLCGVTIRASSNNFWTTLDDSHYPPICDACNVIASLNPEAVVDDIFVENWNRHEARHPLQKI